MEIIIKVLPYMVSIVLFSGFGFKIYKMGFKTGFKNGRNKGVLEGFEEGYSTAIADVEKKMKERR